ncbi:hypothetical protein FIBSPDRAFT_816776 [Athelia psychrophila]|uniref:Chromatin modification-related protein n=1 Tax=Athelia psychrophila TaxID=1759441 RepID=A0A166S1K1_9AGAM|nr:hypothetical protein FIBSPDRAFT_816776 [Fibularhizoctonia sp. CBS 109695]
MSRSRTAANNETQIYNAYSLSLLSEYTHTLDSLPLDLSRNFADLRELDAVLSSQMASTTLKIRNLTQMIEDGAASKEDRLLLLQDIASEASNLKMGGDDKIRVACQAADNLKLHMGHMKSLLRNLPSFDMSVLNRQTVFPHVASRSYQPPATTEAGRRRRGVGSLLSAAPDPSPVKRRRVQEEYEIVPAKPTPRKDKVAEVSAQNKSRSNGSRKKPERAHSPSESVLSVTSHLPQQIHASSSRLGAANSLSRAATVAGASKRAKPRHAESYEEAAHDHNRSRDIYNAPPSSSAAHPSLAYGAAANGYDAPGALPSGADWAPAPAGQLAGPGMPVARSTSRPALAASPSNLPVAATAAVAVGGAPAEGDAAEGDGDDKTYCFCDGISYGEMIACDETDCEREWFHLACIGLTVPPEGAWFCETCKTKRAAKRGNRGGKRRAAGGARSGGKAANGA